MNEPKKSQTTLDVKGSLMNLGEMVARRSLEPACGKLPLWDNGLGDLLGMAIDNSGVQQSITAQDVARSLGIMPRKNPRRKGQS